MADLCPIPSLSAPVHMDIALIIAGLPSDVVDKIAKHFEKTSVGDEEKGFLDFVEGSPSTRRAALRLLNGRILLHRGHKDFKRWAMFGSEHVTELSIVAPLRWWDVAALEPLVQCPSLTSLSLRGCVSLISSLRAPLMRLSLFVSHTTEVEPVSSALRQLNPIDLDLSVAIPFSSFCSLQVLRDALALPSVRTLTLACDCLLPSGTFNRHPKCIAMEIAAHLPVLDRFIYRSKDRYGRSNCEPYESSSDAICFAVRLGYLFHDVRILSKNTRVNIEGRGRIDGQKTWPQCFTNEHNGLFESPQRSMTLTGAGSKLLHGPLEHYFRNTSHLEYLRIDGGRFEPYIINRVLRALSPALRQLHVSLASQVTPDLWLCAIFQEILQSSRGLQVLSLAIAGQQGALRRRLNRLRRETEETNEARLSLLSQWSLVSSEMPDLLVLDAEHGETVSWQFLDTELYGSEEETYTKAASIPKYPI